MSFPLPQKTIKKINQKPLKPLKRFPPWKPAASRILGCRISRGSSLQIKRPASTLASVWMLDFCVDPSGRNQKKLMEEKKKQDKHHVQLNDLNILQTSPFSWEDVSGYPQSFPLILRVGLLLAKAMDHPNSQQLWT